jgi:hypothetical protein
MSVRYKMSAYGGSSGMVPGGNMLGGMTGGRAGVWGSPGGEGPGMQEILNPTSFGINQRQGLNLSAPSMAANQMATGPQSDTGFGGVPWRDALANQLNQYGRGMNGGSIQPMPYGGGPINPMAYGINGGTQVSSPPNAYANMQAKVAANHPGWNQDQINGRAGIRLGNRLARRGA